MQKNRPADRYNWQTGTCVQKNNKIVLHLFKRVNCQSGTNRSDRFVPKLTYFADCTLSLKCCTFRVSLRRRRFRDPVGVSCLRRVTKPDRVKRGRSRRQREALSRKRAESIQSCECTIRHRLSFRGRASSANKRSAESTNSTLELQLQTPTK